MRTRIIGTISLFSFLTLAPVACSPDLPPVMKAVPAGTDVVGSIDAKTSLDYIKNTLPKIVPAKLKDKIPSFADLTKQAMMLAGLDMEKLTTLHFFGDMQGKSWTLVAQGLSAQGLKGKASGKYKATDYYKILGGPVYAELKGLGLVVSADETALKKVIDTFHGDSKRLVDTDKGKLIRDMLKIHKDMDLLRIYILTGKLPELPMAGPMNIEGGGIFMDLDKGAALTILTDKAGADKIAQAVGIGLMTAQAALMMGGGKDMPVALDADTKKVFTEFLGKVKTAKKQAGVTISYQGDLKPIIEKTLSLGAKLFAQRPIPMPAVEPKELKKDQAANPQEAKAAKDTKASPETKDKDKAGDKDKAVPSRPKTQENKANSAK